jgi:hypothetical protein
MIRPSYRYRVRRVFRRISVGANLRPMGREAEKKDRTEGDPAGTAISSAVDERAVRHVELDIQRLRLELKKECQRQRYTLLRRMFDGLKVSLWILASGPVFLAMEPIIGDIAGTTTNVTVSIGVSLTLAVGSGVGWAQAEVKAHVRKTKVRRQRQRSAELEGRIKELQRLVRGGNR